MALDKDGGQIKFVITASSVDAQQDFERLADKAESSSRRVEDAFEKDPFADMRLRLADMKRRADDLTKSTDGVADGLDKAGNSARRSSGGFGQLVESLGEGDIGEILGEIAQQAGPAAFGVAFVSLAFVGAAVAVGAMSKAVIENSREVTKLGREYKLTGIQIQSLQSLAVITGESVEDLAENFKKVAPQAKILEKQIKDTGAEIDEGLRANTRKAIIEFEGLHVAATGAMNDIVRGALPGVIELLKETNALLADNRDLWIGIGNAAGAVLEFVSAAVRAANQALQDYRLLLLDIGTLGITFAIRSAQNFQNRETTGGVDFGPDPLDIPNIKKGKSGGAGKKDITALREEIGLLEVQEKAIQRLAKAKIELAKAELAADTQGGSIDDKTAAYERYAETVLNAENEMAAARDKIVAKQIEETRKSDLLPREKNLKLAQLREEQLKIEADHNQKVMALETEMNEARAKLFDDYLELLRKVDEAETRHLEEMTKKKVKELQALSDFNARMAALFNDRKRIEYEIDKFETDRLERAGADPLKIAERRSRGDAAQENESFRAAQASIRREREQNYLDALEGLQTYEQYILRLEALDKLEEAERRRHAEALKEISRLLQVDAENLNPLSARSILGDTFADALDATGSKFEALKAIVTNFSSTTIESLRDLGSIGADAFEGFAQGIGATVKQFVILGTTGPAVLRRLLAESIASIAAEAAVNSVKMLAVGFANLAVMRYDAAAQAFTSAAIWASIAGVAAVAGRAIAPASSSGSGAGAASNSSTSSNEPRIINQDTSRNSQQTQVLILRADPEVMIERQIQNYRGNGAMRGELLQEFRPA